MQPNIPRRSRLDRFIADRPSLLFLSGLIGKKSLDPFGDRFKGKSKGLYRTYGRSPPRTLYCLILQINITYLQTAAKQIS
jgi:hypothetical protein